jgi:hypothetical protein
MEIGKSKEATTININPLELLTCMYFNFSAVSSSVKLIILQRGREREN